MTGILRDTAITARIETTFMLNKYLSPYTIETKTQNGHVTLNGNVDDYIEKDLAGRLAKSAAGVTGVTNNLVISPEAGDQSDAVLSENPEAAQRELERQLEEVKEADVPPADAPDTTRSWSESVSDATLRADIRSQLAYNTAYQDLDIAVEVEDGGVELEGYVPTEEQKQAVETTVRAVPGVRQVQNKLVVGEPLLTRASRAASTVAESATDLARRAGQAASEAAQRVDEKIRGESGQRDLKGALSDNWVEKRIEANIALNRNVSILDLDVEVQSGVCTLSGSVIAEQQRQLAEDIARTTPGVAEVVNKVQVRDIP